MIKSRKLLSLVMVVTFLLCNTLYLDAFAASTGSSGTVTLNALSQGNGFFNVVLQRDGTIWGWGDNSGFQLGDGTNTNRYTPVQMKDPKDPTGYIHNVVQIAQTPRYSIMLKKDGTVWYAGALGRDKELHMTPGRAKAPEDPTGYLSQIVAIAAEGDNSFAVKKDGTLWAVGWDYGGYTNFTMLPNIDNVASVAASDKFTAVLKKDGTVWAFGKLKGASELYGGGDMYNRLKDTEDSTKYLTGVVRMFGSGRSIAFVKKDGTVKIITSNDSVKWDSISREEKITVKKLNFFPAEKGILNDAVSMSFSIETGNFIICRKDGSVWVWSSYIEEGNDFTPTDLRQVKEIKDAVEVRASGAHYLVLARDGTLYSWGTNNSGQLGDGTKMNRDNPVIVKGLKITSNSSQNQMVLKFGDTPISITGELSGTQSKDNLVLDMQYNIAADKTWKITSNVALNKATVSSKNISIVDISGNVFKSSVSLTDGGKTILVKPSANFAPSRIYHLTVSGVKSTKGHQLFKTAVIPFSVKSSASIDKSIGNSSGNILNGGYAVLDNGWIYYRGSDSKLYKMTADGKSRTKLSNDDPTYINVSGNYIYYENANDNYIYKVNKNGSGRTLVYRGITDDLNVVGDSIYFIKTDSTKTGMGPLYKADTNGKGLKEVVLRESNVFSLYAQGNTLFYSTSNYNALARSIIVETSCVRTDGSNYKIVLTNSAYVDVAGDWVFDILSADQCIYKGSRDGLVSTRLSENKAGTVNVAGDWVYYVNKGDNGSLYKMSLDGKKVYKIGIPAGDCPVGSVNVAGNWIFADRKMYNEKNLKLTQVSTGTTSSSSTPSTPSTPETPSTPQVNTETAKQYYFSGIEHLKTEEYDLAVEDFNKAISLDPGNPLYYYNAGVVYAILGEYDLSMSNMKKVFELKPDYADAYYDCAVIQEVYDHKAEAVESYNKFLQYADKNDKRITEVKAKIQELGGQSGGSGNSGGNVGGTASLIDFNPANTAFIPTKDPSRTCGGKVALVCTSFDGIYTGHDSITIFSINNQYSSLTLSLAFASDQEDSIDVTIYDADKNMELRKLTLNKGETVKNVCIDVSGVKRLAVKMNNIQNEMTKNGYSVYYMNGYPKNTVALIDPVLTK